MKRTVAHHYLIAIPFVLAAWACQSLIGNSFGQVFAFVPFLFAAIVVSWLGGARGTLVAAGLGYLIITYLYVTPGTISISGKDNFAALSVYVGLSLSSGLLAEFFHRSRHEAESLAERLQIIFQSMSDGVCLTNEDGIAIYTNASEDRMFGYDAGEIIGRPISIQFANSVDETQRLLAAVKEHLKSHTVWTGDLRNVRKDGTEFITSSQITPLQLEGKSHYIWVRRDVTQQRRAEEALRESERTAQERLALLDHVYDTAPVGLGLVGRDLRYVRINKHLAQMDGRTPDECLGRSLRELVPDLADRLEPLYQRILETGEPVVSSEIRGRTPADPQEQHDWLASYYPVRNADGAIVGVSSVIIDITERKRAEESLRDADRRKNEFLAMLAHELRNPLATIHYATKLARHPDTKAQQHDWSAVIDRQVQHLARLVDDLLDVSRITRGQIRLQRETVDACTIIRRAVEGIQPVMIERRHELQLELPSQPLAIDADPNRIEQVLQNLLNNAAKYTEPGGQIHVSAAATGRELVMTVSDTGVGMPAHLIPRVFDLFTQGERTLDRSQGGLGIGLTLVRQIVELHGGRVHASSAGVGQGSRFTVTLPLAQTPPTSNPTVAPRQVDQTARRVLVVEDNPDAAYTLRLLLESAGHLVAVCNHGDKALDAARSFGPEVVLLDIGLPGKDGYEVARELRRDQQLGGSYIVALSGYGQESDRARTKAAGFDCHLVKPVDFETLSATIGRHQPLRQRSQSATV